MKRVRVTPTKTLSILDAISDPQLFAPWFKDRETWQSWFTFLKVIFALPLSSTERDLYQQCTGRKDPPNDVAHEAWLVCGRRAGKSFVLALIAVFLACFHSYAEYLAPGERGTVLVIATDRKQARVIFRYIRALLTQIPMLARMVQRETSDTFDLANFVSIEVGTASFRSTRGYTIVAALCDELAFWLSEDSSSPDFEVLNAIRPAMSTIPNAMLLCASSPYARRGALWDAHRRHFAKDGDPILVWQAETRQMNPTIPQSVIDVATEHDPLSAAAEYLAQFRTDVEAFLTREAVEGCIALGVRERPFIAGVRYVGFIDPSGGSSDSMTLCIGHREGDGVIIDCLRERRPPFSPDDVTIEFATILSSYCVRKITGDRYGGEWCREPFKKHGIEYALSDKPKSDLYRDLLPSINSKRVDLLDHPRLVTQLVGLERRTARGGRDSIDHAPGGHDDLCNVVAGCVASLVAKRGGYDTSLAWVTDDDRHPNLARLVAYVASGGQIR